jgi:flagellar motor switch protein FliN/FliY
VSDTGERLGQLVLDVSVEVAVELGSCAMRIRDAAGLVAGSVIALDRAADAPVDVRVNGTLVARGTMVAVDDRYGVVLTELLVPGA